MIHRIPAALFSLIVCFSIQHVHAQDALKYQKPPAVMEQLLLSPPTPSVSIDDAGKYLVLSERSSYPSIEDLAQPEMRIAGLRINPKTFGASRAAYTVNFKIKDIQTGKEVQVLGLPAKLKAGGPYWSPKQTAFSFTQTTNSGIDLYVVDVKTAMARKVNKTLLNMVVDGVHWENETTMWYTGVMKPASAAPAQPIAPSGPVIQQNLGKTAASRTYQDLIKNEYDASLFEFYATGKLIRNVNGVETVIGKPGIYTNLNLSPDEKYLMIERIEKPFSYLVPASGFASSTILLDKKGNEVKLLAKNPGSETVPTGFDNIQNIPARFNWRNDEPATVYWMQPLDSGLYKNKMEFHDEVLMLRAPFTSTPQTLVKTNYRFQRIVWGNATTALLYESVRRQQMQKVSVLNPETGAVEKLYEISSNDAYGDPGSPVTTKNNLGQQALSFVEGKKILLTSNGSSPKGDLPFLSVYDLLEKKNNIIWRSGDNLYESVVKVIDGDKKVFVTSKQSQSEPPNYYIRNLNKNNAVAITQFTDPQPALRKVGKEKIHYKRKDGIDLTATLYTPEGYQVGKDKPLPVFMWAYPREFKSGDDAAQVRGSQNTFTRLSWGSPVYWVTQGYAVMDATEFPIVGEGEKEPNDNFVDQLIWNAEAAINKVVEMKVGDRNRVSIGGHSYGAFMTANLLSHSRLFKAGIARSGAYNRTLTPFGFQNEERTYWQAPEVYNAMSPFSSADKVKDAMLLIHGEADNNPGTFPIQSERLYNAIKGHGGTVRYVQLPYEAHSYAAKENLLHMLWEMNEWLDKYVKNLK